MPDLSHLAPALRAPLSSYSTSKDAFAGACQDFDDLIRNLQALRDAKFGFTREWSTWAEAGSVGSVNDKLAAAIAFMTGTEE